MLSLDKIESFVSSLAFRKALSVGLRSASLAAKLLLTLYMGRYLSLSDIGLYGLVFSAVMVGTGILGFRLDFIMGRDLVGASAGDSFRMIRDQTLFYGANFLFLVLLGGMVFLMGLASLPLLVAVFVITLMESLAQAYTTNMISMGKPLLSTFLFFLRSGLWCLVVVVLGLAVPETRNVETILIAWAMGATLGVVLPLWIWRRAPWGRIFKTPMDRKWLKAALRKSLPIWMGTIGAMTASSMDRFVVSYYLDLEKVGIVTFYSSFALALLSLIHSGFFAFSYPRMIALHKESDVQGFRAEARRTGVEVSFFVLACAAFLGVVLPLCADLFGKPELAEESYTFWLMLAGVWVRANADVLYYVLYARGRDKPLWLGETLYLLPMAAANIILVPIAGLPGVGYGSIIAAFFLLSWFAWFVFRKKPQAL